MRPNTSLNTTSDRIEPVRTSLRLSTKFWQEAA